MTQYAFFFDQSRCTNCHACAIACRDWNDIYNGPVKPLRMMQWETGTFPQVNMHTLFATCYHCENPVCADACPNNAIFKEDEFGAVLVDSDLCKGARDCWLACPYGAPQFEDDTPGTPMFKCTMCYDKLVAGELPICVAACENRALDFGLLSDMEEKYGTLHALEGMPRGDNEKPAIVFKPMTKKVKHVPYDEAEVLRLMGPRIDNLPNVYDDPSEVTDDIDGIIAFNTLVMKSPTVEETLARSKNEDG